MFWLPSCDEHCGVVLCKGTGVSPTPALSTLHPIHVHPSKEQDWIEANMSSEHATRQRSLH